MTVGQQRWWVKMATRRQSTAEHQALQQSRELQCLPRLLTRYGGSASLQSGMVMLTMYICTYIICVQYSNMVMGELCNIILMQFFS